jgi:poly-gamma-glutamate capsule biosynthesis protein CapA/YwtB (metallophosphatase superfamily)
MTLVLALAGDTMLGRGVAEALLESRRPAIAPEVVAVAAEADLFVLNLECCISERGEPWPDPRKPFFFRAPPVAAEVLVDAGVDCVTLANNHALDYGMDALLDTLDHLSRAGIAYTGAGLDEESARAPARLSSGEEQLVVVAACDHPRDFAAARERPGVAYADLWGGKVPKWLRRTISDAASSAPVLVSPHWGPNMTAEPVPHVRDAATELVSAGAAVVAGHSAHVFHGVDGRVLYDLGDFVDDYAIDPVLRNDLGLLFLVTLEAGRSVRLEAVPLKLEYCHTRLADGEDARWVRRRFQAACERMGTTVRVQDGRLVAEPADGFGGGRPGT